jgi:hypothetical protein
MGKFGILQNKIRRMGNLVASTSSEVPKALDWELFRQKLKDLNDVMDKIQTLNDNIEKRIQYWNDD